MRPSVLACALVLLTSCAQEVIRPAPFRVRPDSVSAGDLRGPFDGQVTDAASGDPVAGALVYATWTFERGYGTAVPAGFREAVTSTNASGHYNIDRLKAVPEGARLSEFVLVIYKRGYVAYRSDHRFGTFAARRDFSQRKNEVVLERWRSDFSHARHLRYVGNGPAIAALTAWEVEEAAAELSGETSIGPRVASNLLPSGFQRRLVAAQLLGEQEIRKITDFDGEFESGPLNDEPDTDTYSSQHFRALGQPETFDIALRLWRLEDDAAEERYTELSESLPGVEETNEIADRSFRAIEGDILGLVFYDRGRDAVVLMTCGSAQCETKDQLLQLGHRAFENLKTLTPSSEEQP